MRTIIIILIVLFVIAAVITFGLFFYTFYNAPKKRKKAGDCFKRKGSFADHRKTLEPLLEKLMELPFEQFFITSHDGLKLAARYYRGDEGAPFVLMMHGYRAFGPNDFCGSFDIFREKGWNILMPDERACGISEGNFVTFGVKERRDCMDWINLLLEKFGRDIQICLYGVSMGSATVMMTLALDPPENVKGVIADCGYTSPKGIITGVAESLKLPATQLYPFARLGARLIGGFDPDSASPIDAVSRTKVPILFIHGEDDAFVPFRMCGELYDACASEKYKLTVPGAAHAVSSAKDIKAYAAAVTDFTDRYFKAPSRKSEKQPE